MFAKKGIGLVNVILSLVMVAFMLGICSCESDSDDSKASQIVENDNTVYIVHFKPKASFTANTPKELLAEFNKNHPGKVNTHHFRTKAVNGVLFGYMCVDSKKGCDAVTDMLNKSDKLQFINARQASEADLAIQYDLKQESQEQPANTNNTNTTNNVAKTYIVYFKPITPFNPQTPNELLAVVNEKMPSGTKTHHFRTWPENNILTGAICVDSEAGRDKFIEMLKSSGKLEYIKADEANEADLQKFYQRKQESLETAATPTSSTPTTSTTTTSTFIVYIKPKALFNPQKPNELLAAINEIMPSDVKNHHLRTWPENNLLSGAICVDSETGKDKFVEMLKSSTKLEYIKADAANESDLQKFYQRKQESLYN